MLVELPLPGIALLDCLAKLLLAFLESRDVAPGGDEAFLVCPPQVKQPESENESWNRETGHGGTPGATRRRDGVATQFFDLGSGVPRFFAFFEPRHPPPARVDARLERSVHFMGKDDRKRNGGERENEEYGDPAGLGPRERPDDGFHDAPSFGPAVPHTF